MAKLSTTSVFGDLLVDGMMHGNVTGNLTGNASTATSATTATSAGKWSTARTLTIGNTGKSVDGSGNQSWTLSEIGAFPSTGGTVSGAINLPATATSSNVNHPTQLAYGLLGSYGTLKVLGNTDTSAGADNEYVHIAAGWGLNPAVDKGITVYGTYANCFGGRIYTTNYKPTPADIGAAAASHGSHVTFGTTAPKVAGTAAVGSSTNVSREDHVHPAQASVSGNAGTATKLATARTLTIGSTGKSFDGSANVSWTLSEIGAAAASHGTHLTIGTGASNAAAGNHTHTNVLNQDTRAVNTTPDGAPIGLSVHLKSNGTDSLSDGGSYHSSLFIKGWNDYSGGPYGNLAITANNNLWFRASSSGTAWNSWKKVSVDGHTHSSYATTTTTGSLSSLKTSAKGSLVAAINEVFQSGANVKQQLVDALVAKGVSASTSESWDDLIDKLNGLSGEYTTIDEELLLLDKGTEYNTDLSGGIWTASGIALTSGTGLVITPQSGAYKCFTFRNKIDLRNYTSFEITVQCPAGSTEIGFVIDDTSVLGGTYSSYGNATTTRPRAISTDSTFAGGTKTYVFNFAELYDRTGISFDRSLYIGFAFGYASGNYTITNIKLRNNRTVSNKMDIISAASLPATGKENQLCAITSTTPNRFVIADNSADTEVSDNIVRIRTTENAACTAYTYPMGNIFLNLRIAAVYQNRSAIPLWLYRNNEWIQICFTSDFALKNKVVQPQFPLATDLQAGCHFHSSYGITITDSTNSNMLLGTPFQSAINFSKYKAIRIKGSWTGGSTYPSAYAPVAIGVFGIASRFSSGIVYVAGYRPSEIPNIYSNVKFNKYTVISTSSGGPTSGTFDYTFDINTTATCHLGITCSMIMTTRITDIEFILK